MNSLDTVKKKRSFLFQTKMNLFAHSGTALLGSNLIYRFVFKGHSISDITQKLATTRISQISSRDVFVSFKCGSVHQVGWKDWSRGMCCSQVGQTGPCQGYVTWFTGRSRRKYFSHGQLHRIASDCHGFSQLNLLMILSTTLVSWHLQNESAGLSKVSWELTREESSFWLLPPVSGFGIMIFSTVVTVDLENGGITPLLPSAALAVLSCKSDKGNCAL